ncbi:MAG: fibronectin type III domain-containing protein, partial [bacterium]
MLHLARHRELVVGILRLMVSLCVVFSVEGLNPAQLLAAGALKASWNANTEPDLAGYKIYYGLSSGNYTISINVGNVTQYTVNQLTEGLVYHFVVTAYDTAGNESAYSQEVSGQIPVVDRTPPAITSFRAVNQQTLEVIFGEAVSLTTAQSTANYTIAPAITVQSAKLQTDNRTIMIATAQHTLGVNYTLTVRGIADRAPTPNVMAPAATFNYSFRSTDGTPPVVSNVRLINPTTVEVLFNEPVGNASAQTKGNYTINKSIVVASATLQADTRTVNLTTSAHAAGETYSLTVRNVADRATPANAMPQAQTFTYTYQVEDLRPPEVNSVTLTDQTHLLIVFNEQITVASTENAGNYSISDGVQVLEARLAGNGLEVTLLTSAHQYNKDYNIVIRNIKDRSPAANTIAAGTISTYFLLNDSNGDDPGLSVNGLKPARYSVDSLQTGSAYYIDRPYVVRQIPNSKHGLLWIKTASADRNDTGEPFIEFTLTRESNIYVAYDSRTQQPPNWLRNYFSPTNESITVSENNIKLNFWKRRYVPGSVVLGGNMAEGVQASTSLSMYVVLVEDVQAPPTTNSPAPQGFVLFQNYPNPFSATGSIGGI